MENQQKVQEMLFEVQRMQRYLRNVRIQVVQMGLNHTKTKTARVKVLEAQLTALLNQQPRNNILIDDVLDEVGELIIIKPEYHKIAQEQNAI